MMDKHFAKYTIILLLMAGGVWLLNSTTATTFVSLEGDKELVFNIDDCAGITDKSTVHLVAIVEFQKLEIAGRKSAVFKICMKDRGYIENKVWTKQALPIAHMKAKNEQISIDEAFENLRRVEMKWLKPKKGKPAFWVAQK